MKKYLERLFKYRAKLRKQRQAKKPQQPVLNADQPILAQLEELAMNGDKEAEKQVKQIVSNPRRLETCTSLRFPKK
ncbi:MAG: hypothetical protein GY774_17085 [Planctomycetes bacterium]|nr:hypothetical protein [Planctomycetota bacterium]